ncbi:MAG: tRNA (guanosine(46)-N7)-methyltransferase TrmB [Thermodesulfobacteriota bacterium]|nr:tRNA (guanosine(46)-N7)-methyltransferase TrmB [Thermodesulfobacteriota bacterium]
MKKNRVPHYLSLTPLVHWKREKHPIEWEEKFGRSGRLVVEIGFGLGDFLVREASRNPGENFVGVEWGWVTTRRGLRKIAMERLKNVKVINSDARIAFDRLFPQKSVDSVYSLFPSPWPKKRHEKHRLFSRDFLRVLNSRLKEEGRIVIVTDHEDYFNWILSQVSRSGFEARSQIIPPRFETKYEKKWRQLGQQRFFELRLSKQGHYETPIKEDRSLIAYDVEHFDPERFNPTNARGDITIEFKEFLFDPRREKAMVRAMVVEESLIQHFWIEIAKNTKDWHIRLAKGCDIVPTLGVQRALDLAREGTRRPKE